MKLKTSALAMTATLAAGLISSAFADATPYKDLVFKTNQTYTVTVNGSAKTDTKGTWNESAAPLIVDGGAIEFDTDASTPSTFTPAPDNSTCNATELKFNVSAAIVPKNVTLATDADAQCGFAIQATDNATNYMVYVGSDSDPAWVSAGACGLTADAYFDLTVKIDYRNSKAQYLVDDTLIGNEWYDLAAKNTSVGAIDFIGNGKLTSLRGDKLQIISEVVEITPSGSQTKVTLVIPEEQMADIKTAAEADGKAIGTYLNETTDGGNLTHLDAVVLYGKTDVDTSSTDKILVKGNATGTPSAGNVVCVKIDGLAVKDVGGATVKHVLLGSENGTDGWTEVDEGTGANPDLQIPANSDYRYFRVVTSVEYGNK